MDSLIRKLEEATGPSRELDAEIAVTVFPDRYVPATSPAKEGRVGIRSDVVDNGHGYISECDALRYTESWDAAVTLIPARHVLDHACEHWRADDGGAWKTGGATIKLATRMPAKIQAEGRTLILALVLASLKAIQSSKNSDTGRKQ